MKPCSGTGDSFKCFVYSVLNRVLSCVDSIVIFTVVAFFFFILFSFLHLCCGCSVSVVCAFFVDFCVFVVWLLLSFLQLLTRCFYPACCFLLVNVYFYLLIFLSKVFALKYFVNTEQCFASAYHFRFC